MNIISSVLVLLICQCAVQVRSSHDVLQKKGLSCGGSICGPDERCVKHVQDDHCECQFGFSRHAGNASCQPIQGNIFDRIIQINSNYGLLGELFEGDLLLTAAQKEVVRVATRNHGTPLIGKRNSHSSDDSSIIPILPVQYWKFPVPLMFEKSVPDVVKTQLLNRTLHIFKEAEHGDKDFVFVVNEKGCSSSLGRQGGMQLLSIAPNCEDPHIITHLVLHTLGLMHEHNRADRDSFITLHPENIDNGAIETFHKYDTEEDKDTPPYFVDDFNQSTSNLTTEHYVFPEHLSDIEKEFIVNSCHLTQNVTSRPYQYDVCSIMHAGPFSFSKSGKPIFSPVHWRPACPNDVSIEQNFQKLCHVMYRQRSVCGNDRCGVDQVCIRDNTREHCRCQFGYDTMAGNSTCYKLPGNVMDTIIKVNRQKGVLHDMFEGDLKLNKQQETAIQVHHELKTWSIIGKRKVDLGVNINLTDSFPDIPIQYWRLPVPVLFTAQISDTVRGHFMNMQPPLFRIFQSSDPDYVFVVKEDGCYSYVGRQGGPQKLSVGDGCEDELIITHLVLHTLGMWHENNRADRDEYITIHPENIEEGAIVNFHKYHFVETKDLLPYMMNETRFENSTYSGHHLPIKHDVDLTPNELQLIKEKCHPIKPLFPYDVCSIMHIGPFSYSRNGKPVFTPIHWRVPCPDTNRTENDLRKLCFVFAYQLWHQYHKTVGCFPPSSIVQLENGDKKSVGDLMIGDTVMVMDESGHVSYSDVNLMMHKMEEAAVNYHIIETEDGKSLTLSGEHVIYASSFWSFKPETRLAENVKVGDYLVRPQMSNGTFIPVKVVAVKREVLIGAYAPTTLAGNIVVDGHLASSYVFIEDQDIAHGFFLPWRVSYKMYNAIFGKSLSTPSSGLHWSLKAFVSVYCRLIGHEICDTLLAVN